MARWSSPVLSGLFLDFLSMQMSLSATLTRRHETFTLLAFFGGDSFLFAGEFSLLQKPVQDDPDFWPNVLFVRWVVAGSPRRTAAVFEMADRFSRILL